MPTKTFGQGDPPSGAVAWFNDDPANIPAGWIFCDGANGTPDMRGRFMKNVPNASTNPGSTGGQDSYVMNSSQLPSHDHYVGGTDTVGNHDHTFNDGDNMRDGTSGGPIDHSAVNTNVYNNTGESGDHSHNLSVSSSGGNSSIPNVPPYVELVPIMKL